MKHPKLQFRSTVEVLTKATRDMPRLMGYAEAGGKEDFKAWQRKARRKFKDLLGTLAPTVTDPRSWLVHAEECDGFTREFWALESPFGDHIPIYRLVPHCDHGPDAVMLAYHGHGPYGADPVAGVMKGRPGEEDTLRQHNYDYGVQFAQRGYLVYAPCQRGFGMRCDIENPITDPDFLPEPNDPSPPPGCSCIDINTRAIILGSSDMGLRLQDAVQIVDWIKGREGEGELPLGCMGLSGGGHMTQFLAATDARIDAASIQGYFCYWLDQIVDITHCNCNYVPGLLRNFEQDDVSALICPRPLLVTTADEDGVAPVKSFRRAYRVLKGIYRDHGDERDLEQDIFHGGHEFSGRKAFKFFDKHLRRR